MDEASQCVEPEALVPLKLGMYFNNLRDFWSKKIDTKNKTYFYYLLHYFLIFFLGFKKLIMVGDPEQLPATVTSNEAKKQNFNISLYTRIFKTFEQNSADDCPIQRLTVQYRMHSDIMTWPNQYFYGGILRQGDQQRGFHLAHYKVYFKRGQKSREIEILNQFHEKKFKFYYFQKKKNAKEKKLV